LSPSIAAHQVPGQITCSASVKYIIGNRDTPRIETFEHFCGYLSTLRHIRLEPYPGPRLAAANEKNSVETEPIEHKMDLISSIWVVIAIALLFIIHWISAD
jgi:hypothetical protein